MGYSLGFRGAYERDAGGTVISNCTTLEIGSNHNKCAIPDVTWHCLPGCIYHYSFRCRSLRPLDSISFPNTPCCLGFKNRCHSDVIYLHWTELAPQHPCNIVTSFGAASLTSQRCAYLQCLPICLALTVLLDSRPADRLADYPDSVQEIISVREG
jgi:hypothetical protein